MDPRHMVYFAMIEHHRAGERAGQRDRYRHDILDDDQPAAPPAPDAPDAPVASDRPKRRAWLLRWRTA